MMPVLRALFLSLAIHLILLFVMEQFADPSTWPEKGEVTEIEILPSSKSRQQKQIVRQALAPEAIKTTDDSLARFLSEQQQRVKQETRAAEAGLTQNKDGKKPQEEKHREPQKPSRDFAKDGYRTWTPESGNGPSTAGETLPTDVTVGSFTALNTDRFTYYTFYARIEEMIRYRWESRVQSAIRNFDQATAIQSGNKSWVTYAEFWLTPEGKLSKALIMKESGIKPFDSAAINAFREANMFPNPPKELIQEDGFIRLKYNFTVNYAPPPMVR